MLFFGCSVATDLRLRVSVLGCVYASSLFQPEDDQRLQQVLRQTFPLPTPPVTKAAFCLVTLLTTLPPPDLFLLVSTDLISALIKYLPCPATL